MLVFLPQLVKDVQDALMYINDSKLSIFGEHRYISPSSLIVMAMALICFTLMIHAGLCRILPQKMLFNDQSLKQGITREAFTKEAAMHCTTLLISMLLAPRGFHYAYIFTAFGSRGIGIGDPSAFSQGKQLSQTNYFHHI